MKKLILTTFGVVALTLCTTSCNGRTQENMQPNGDTIEIAGGDVVDPEPESIQQQEPSDSTTNN